MEIYFQLITAAVVVSVILFLLGLYRNNLVFQVREQAIEYVYINNLSWIVFDKIDYQAQVCDLRKWTFADFYPQYVERDEHEQF